MIEFIDSEVPDEDRLEAAKAMFFGVNAPDKNEAERLLMYELLKLSKNLSGSQIRTLAVVYELRKEGIWPAGQILEVRTWLAKVAERMGHGVSALVELNESVLMQNKLISERMGADKSAAQPMNPRLTDLGLRFCEALRNYRAAKGELG